MSFLSLDSIADAQAAIDPVFRDSPQFSSDSLAAAFGLANLVLKVETLNPIRSFKGRGASFFVQRLPNRDPLVAASAGNFGQGLAHAGRSRGIPVKIFAATNANPLKLDRMRALGADVILSGDDFDAAKHAARAHATQNGLRFVEDGLEPAIAEGAGTIALELLRQTPHPLDAIVIPVGNGALINGVAAWMKAKSPATRVIGVCAASAPSMERSWRAGRIEATAASQTIADGIAVRVPVPQAVEEMRRTVDEVLFVTEDEIRRAMRAILLHAGLLTEPSGAVGVAAIASHQAMFAGMSVATILCGANVTEQQFAEWFAD